MSPRRNWASPTPFPQASVPLPLWTKGGGAQSPAGEGWGSPNSDDWRKSLPLCLLCALLLFRSLYCKNKASKYLWINLENVFSVSSFQEEEKSSVSAFHLSHQLIFSSVHSWMTFRTIFQNHRRLSDQLLESQAALGKPEQASWRGLHWFHRSKQKLYFWCSSELLQPKFVKTISAHKKCTVLIFRTFKKACIW